MSEETAKKIDAVKKIVDKGYERARKFYRKNRWFDKIAKALLIYETLSGDEIRDLILKILAYKIF